MNQSEPLPNTAEGSEKELTSRSATHLAPILAMAANLLSRDASAYYRKHFGIGLVELRLVFSLGRFERLNPHELSQSTDIDKAAVSRGLRTLQESGWIDIVTTGRAAPRLLISLTEMGREKYRMLEVLATDREAGFVGCFTPEEVSTLKSLLWRLIEHNAKP